MIKVGIIGAGAIGPAHVEAIRCLGYVEVVALCCSSIKSAQRKAEQLNIPYAYNDVDEILKHPGLTVIHNCTPNNLHAEINRKVLMAGKHVFSEKPFCLTIKEARELVTLARDKGLMNGVSFVYRHYPMVQQAASITKQGKAGRVFLTHGGYLQDWLLYKTDYNWRVDEIQGGESRAVGDIGSHWCDTVQYVTGRKIVAVMANLDTVWPIREIKKDEVLNTFDAKKLFQEKQIKNEDIASVLIKFDDNSSGVFVVSQVSAGRKNRLYFEINCSRHSLVWDEEKSEDLILGFRDKPNELLSAYQTEVCPDSQESSPQYIRAYTHGGRQEAFRCMMESFYSSLKYDHAHTYKHDYATFYDGAYGMFIIDAILRSHREKRWVDVESL
ncbi:TPA: Gfo/Idh/MocA family protein [Klebsiella pneumoniae]